MPRSAYSDDAVFKGCIIPLYSIFRTFSNRHPSKLKMLTRLSETPDNGDSYGVEKIEQISNVIDSYSSQLWDINQKVRMKALIRQKYRSAFVQMPLSEPSNTS